MNTQKKSWLVGAYSLTGSLPSFSRADAEQFYGRLQDMPSIIGLELPIHCDSKADDPWPHLDLLPRHWNYILTDMPGVMQSLGRNAQFGLASTNDTGRAEAITVMQSVHQRVQQLNQHCGRTAVVATHLHSAPSLTASSDALRVSLNELKQWDWHGAELWLEHCDAHHPGEAIPEPGYAKGFLPLIEELQILKDLNLGLTLNWGRSVLEGRDAATVLHHIQDAQTAGVLRAMIFSGMTVADPLYGNWQDNHAPLALNSDAAWEPSKSLFTQETLVASLKALSSSNPLLGIKVQPAPKSLSLKERLDFMEAQLVGFDAVVAAEQ